MAHLDQFRKRFLSAATFARRAFREVENLSRDDYLLRPGREIRPLIQEVLPLAMVAKHLDIPSRRVCCKYLGRTDDDCDGEIMLAGEWVESGFLKPRYNVEVTSAQFEKEHYIREALARYGSVFYDPEIKKERGSGQIISRAVVQDGDQIVKDSIRWVKDAVGKKVNKPKPYPQPCILVIALGLERPLGLSEWLSVVSGFPCDIAKRRFDFAFLVHTDVGAVHYVGWRS